MTNNQNQFNREVQRLQKEIEKLTKHGRFKQGSPLPEQPKRITKRTVEEVKSLKGRQFVEPIRANKKLNDRTEELSGSRKSSQSTYIPTPHKHVEERKTRSDKGVKRGKLTPEEAARRNAKRLETMRKNGTLPKPQKDRKKATSKELNDRAVKRYEDRYRYKGRRVGKNGKLVKGTGGVKTNVTRKTRKDKGTHLTAEERAKRNAKRLETIAKKSRPTTSEYAQPQTSYPEYNMVEWILDRLTQAKSVVIETQPMQSYGKQATRHSRVSYLDSLIQLVASNLQAEDYYNTIASREEQIASHIDTIVYASDQDDVDNSFTELYTLLSPDPVSLDELKRISEEAENYNVENYNG